MMPARLTRNPLVREGEEGPSGDAPACTVQTLPASRALARPAATRGPLAEILVPVRLPVPATAGSGRSGRDDRVSLAVRIDRALHRRLRVLAALQGRTNQDIVRCALDAYLDAFAGGCACVRDRRPRTRGSAARVHRLVTSSCQRA